MTEVSPVVLMDILDNDSFKKVWRYLRGCRVYFPKAKAYMMR